MNGKHYIGCDLHRKTISYCAKQLDGTVQDEGVIEATRTTIREWAAHRQQKWIGAMEATRVHRLDFRRVETARGGVKALNSSLNSSWRSTFMKSR
jgi:hypothetical protein